MALDFRVLILGLLTLGVGLRMDCLAEETAAPVPPPATKKVLILYGERPQLPAMQAVTAGLLQGFSQPVDGQQVEVFTESLDATRFPATSFEPVFVDYLRARYAGRKLDAVIPVAGAALDFVLRHRDLFPGVPIVFCAAEQRDLKDLKVPPDITGVPITYNVEGTIDLARRLQPNARDVLVVSGVGAYDKRWEAVLLQVLKSYAPDLRVRTVHDLPVEGMVQEAARLSPNTIVFMGAVLRDVTGKSYNTRQVTKMITDVSPAPVYSFAAHLVPDGIVGGTLQDFSTIGNATAELTDRVLRGEQPLPPIDLTPHTPLVINWKAIEKWHLPASRLPPEAVILYREPTLWQQHRALIIGTAAVVLTQTTMLIILLVERRQRQRAEESLVKSEERISLAAESAGLGLWVWDIARGNLWVSETFRQIFNLERINPIDFEAFCGRIHPEDRAVAEAGMRKAMADHADYEIEYRTAARGGDSSRWIISRGRAVYDATEQPVRLLGVCIDVTARRKIEAEIQNHRRELTHLSRVATMGAMTASLAHELNQPLAAIVSNASAGRRFIARGEVNEAELKELLQDIADDGQRAGEVIQGIRRMVRKDDLKHEPVDLNEVIGRVARLLYSDALNRDCTIVTEPAAKLPKVVADRVQLKQVLFNLILNGFDAMENNPPGKKKLVIRTEAEGDQVRVLVRDEGTGLPTGLDGRIFDEFFTTKPEGMGMGLAIARSIVQAHGGTLRAANAAGGGAVFTIELPMRKGLAA